ncbi:MAG: hypothetical protein GY758_02840 [Fuerstiella sp.]|nr:hypothetical protein [Fuerstiella sp.]MCP4513401.1 hypothetical protein [Fuerstiella sp.]
MSIEELLQQMADYKIRREHRDHRPIWLKEFIHNVADIFEPLANAGRVGFDCRADERGWLVSMYLGTTEMIGGPKDGQIEHVGFRIDIHQLLLLFNDVSRCEWYSVGNERDERFEQAVRSLLSVTGQVDLEHSVRLELLGVPPKYVGPALKQYSPSHLQ